MTKEQFTKEVRAAEVTLYRVSKSILHNDEYCMDAVQEAIYKAFSNLDKLKNEKLFKTWLVRILINECYRIQKEQKRVIYYNDSFNQEVVGIRADYTDLYHSIETLSPKIKIAIILYYIEGLSISEIKVILKIPEGTVKSRLAKGREQLKNYLSGEGI